MRLRSRLRSPRTAVTGRRVAQSFADEFNPLTPTVAIWVQLV